MVCNVETLGQVFTPEIVVDFMVSLRQNQGTVLEPSCGDGAFLKHLGSEAIGIELDALHCPPRALNMDFFDYTGSGFDTIIGNPPYVRHQKITPETKAKLDMELFDGRANLYLFFIKKCVDMLNEDGELIFITPREFMTSTSSVKLNKWLYQQGRLTHYVEFGDTKVFKGASPNVIVWRYQKTKSFSFTFHTALFNVNYCKVKKLEDLTHVTWQRGSTQSHQGQISFTSLATPTLALGTIATVKVGAASGADSLFVAKVNLSTFYDEAIEFVCSHTRATGATARMLYNIKHPGLAWSKLRLMHRKIRTFDETNWWQWGRAYPHTEAPRVYVNVRTRQADPFFLHPCLAFTGSVLAIFPKNPSVDLTQFCRDLNDVDWEAQGFKCGGRVLFSQRGLENTLLPETFKKYL